MLCSLKSTVLQKGAQEARRLVPTRHCASSVEVEPQVVSFIGRQEGQKSEGPRLRAWKLLGKVI